MFQERSNPMEESIRNPLPRLEKQLAEEYEAVPEDRIHEVAKQALDELADARVREFVPIFAWRHAESICEGQPSDRAAFTAGRSALG